MSTASPSPGDGPENGPRAGADRSGLRWNAWNLLLLVPLLMLITPWFNKDQPRLGGLPFFYWYQFLFVLVGVACVWIVYAMSRKRRSESAAPAASDEEGGR